MDKLKEIRSLDDLKEFIKLNKGVLKKAALLTRQPRMKERKKYGLKAARRAREFSKR